MLPIWSCIFLWNEPLARYVILRVANAPGMPGTFYTWQCLHIFTIWCSLICIFLGKISSVNRTYKVNFRGYCYCVDWVSIGKNCKVKLHVYKHVKQYREIQVAYNNVFRRLMGYEKFCSSSGMFVANRSVKFDTRIRRLAYGFYQRLIVSENSLVKCVVNSSAWLSSKLYANWNKCLYVSQIVV